MQTIFKHRIIKNIRRQYHISEIRIQATIAARHLTTTNIQNSTGHAPRIQNVNKELCVIRDCAAGWQKRQRHRRFVYIVWVARTYAWTCFIMHGKVLGTKYRSNIAKWSR